VAPRIVDAPVHRLDRADAVERPQHRDLVVARAGDECAVEGIAGRDAARHPDRSNRIQAVAWAAQQSWFASCQCGRGFAAAATPDEAVPIGFEPERLVMTTLGNRRGCQAEWSVAVRTRPAAEYQRVLFRQVLA